MISNVHRPRHARVFALIAILFAPAVSAQVRQLDHVGAAGGESFHTNGSHGRALSRNGRWVVFRSNDTTLVPGSSNDHAQVYLLDRVTRSVEHISFGPNGPGNGSNLNATISHDGRVVAYTSDADNLVPGDTNANGDIFVRDRVAGTTTRVSVSTAGSQALGYSGSLAISGNGRIVAFASDATQLVIGLNGLHMQVFIHDRDSSTTELISRTVQGTPGEGVSGEPTVSADGRYVAFQSNANHLVPGDNDFLDDIFVFDRHERSMTLLTPVGGGMLPSISDDGLFVGFHTSAALVPGDTNGAIDGYVVDRSTLTMRQATLNHQFGQLQFGAFYMVISGDGQWVTFISSSANVVPGLAGGTGNAFVRHLGDGRVRQLSVNVNGVQPDSNSIFPTIGRNGAVVGFASDATNLLPTVGAATSQTAVYLVAPDIDEINADGFD